MKIQFKLKEIPKDIAFSFIKTHHYSDVMPRLNTYFVGGYIENELLAVMTLGWGVRPLHTIKKLFPSCSSKDYLEIGKMCLHDRLLRNSETQFIKEVILWLKKKNPKLKILYTWADGMLGKPGYVYQAGNFLYGGFIWTDSYFTETGQKIHPRSTRELCKQDAILSNKEKVFWLSEKFQHQYKIHRYKGKQFRYIYFLCGNKERKRLLSESTVKWALKYPKHRDLMWKKLLNGKYVLCEQPRYIKQIQSYNQTILCVGSIKSDTSDIQSERIGAIPIQRINFPLK